MSKVAKRNRVRRDWRKAPVVEKHFAGQAELLDFIREVTNKGTLFFGLTADTKTKTDSVRAAKLRCFTGVRGKQDTAATAAKNARCDQIGIFDTNAENFHGERAGEQGAHRCFKTYNIHEIRVNGTRYVVSVGGSSPEALNREATRLEDKANELRQRATAKQGTLAI